MRKLPRTSGNRNRGMTTSQQAQHRHTHDTHHVPAKEDTPEQQTGAVTATQETRPPHTHRLLLSTSRTAAVCPCVGGCTSTVGTSQGVGGAAEPEEAERRAGPKTLIHKCAWWKLSQRAVSTSRSLVPAGATLETAGGRQRCDCV